MICKTLAVGIIVLFVGIILAPSISGNISKSLIEDDVDDSVIFPIYLDITLKFYFYNLPFNVTITYPENGIYYNNHKILPFFVPLVLSGEISVYFKVEGHFSNAEVYINGNLEGDLTPPYDFTFGKWWGGRPFSRVRLKVIEYLNFEEYGSDEVIIWRLFS
jgi:hypothetical protein